MNVIRLEHGIKVPSADTVIDSPGLYAVPALEDLSSIRGPEWQVGATPGVEQTDTLARWRQVAFHVREARSPVVAEVAEQRGLHRQQAALHMRQLGLVEATAA